MLPLEHTDFELFVIYSGPEQDLPNINSRLRSIHRPAPDFGFRTAITATGSHDRVQGTNNSGQLRERCPLIRRQYVRVKSAKTPIKP